MSRYIDKDMACYNRAVEACREIIGSLVENGWPVDKACEAAESTFEQSVEFSQRIRPKSPQDLADFKRIWRAGLRRATREAKQGHTVPTNGDGHKHHPRAKNVRMIEITLVIPLDDE